MVNGQIHIPSFRIAVAINRVEAPFYMSKIIREKEEVHVEVF